MNALLQVTLAAVARLEAAGVKPARLTEPDFTRWHRFRRKLGWADFIDVLFEDLAGAFPVPFALKVFERPTEAEAEALIQAAAVPNTLEPLDFLRHCAHLLDLPTGALSEAPRIQPAERVLELPGSGGRIAAAMCLRDSGLSFAEQFTFVAPTPAEQVAVGLAAVELRANRPTLTSTPPAGPFDRVVGLRAAHSETDWPEAKWI